MAFVDELTIYAKAGDGGDGVVRWDRGKFTPKGGPAGGNGGRGGDVYIRAIRNLNQLAKYTGDKEFKAQDAAAGDKKSMHGKASEDLYIDIPIGATVTDLKRGRVYELTEEGQTEKILHGGGGGLGNEYFKSSTNQTPEQSTPGKPGEDGEFKIDLTLVVDIGLVGKPNAGKSTLLNTLTNARSQIGAYPFTTLEPHLGDFYGYMISDIPGLVEGASEGKGLGHKFLRHVEKTKMILHLVSLTEEDPKNAYSTICNELSDYNKTLGERESWIILTKKDLVEQHILNTVKADIDKLGKRVFVISCETKDGVKELQDALVSHLRTG